MWVFTIQMVAALCRIIQIEEVNLADTHLRLPNPQ